MSASVDVLAVLNEVIGTIPPISPQHKEWIDRVERARAVVAELIEATDCLTDAIANDRSYREDILKGLRPLERHGFVSALQRARAALARVGGVA